MSQEWQVFFKNNDLRYSTLFRGREDKKNAAAGAALPGRSRATLNPKTKQPTTRMWPRRRAKTSSFARQRSPLFSPPKASCTSTIRTVARTDARRPASDQDHAALVAFVFSNNNNNNNNKKTCPAQPQPPIAYNWRSAVTQSSHRSIVVH